MPYLLVQIIYSSLNVEPNSVPRLPSTLSKISLIGLHSIGWHKQHEKEHFPTTITTKPRS